MIEDKNDLKDVALFVLGIVVIGGACLLAFAQFKHNRTSVDLKQHGVKTMGMVTGGNAPWNPDRERQGYALKVVYTVGGRTYEHRGQVSEDVFESHTRDMKTSPAAIDLIYLPEDPEICVFAHSGLPDNPNDPIIGCGVAIILGGLGVLGIRATLPDIRRIFTRTDHSN